MHQLQLSTALADDIISQTTLCGDDPLFFSWIGVTMHLAPDQVMHTLQTIACCAAGSGVLFDYCALPAPDAQTAGVRSAFHPARLEHMLRHFGFRQIEHLAVTQADSALRVMRATI
jgi:O-methyltransferase involved in polyketide biosynthesis